jgi:hypothetical protein
MVNEFEGKTTLHPDGSIDVYGKVDTEYVTDLAIKHFEKIKSTEIDTSGVFNEKQNLMMYALPKELRMILSLIKRYYDAHDKSWPTQARIRDDFSQENGKKCDDVQCKRKIDELEKKAFVLSTSKTRGKKVMFTKYFMNMK